MSDQMIPIFPLGTILFPGSKLPLRIFEPRYLDMVSACMRSNREFGIVLSRKVPQPGMLETYATGTLAKIIDWNQGDDGLLGIITFGTNKFELLSMTKQEDGLNIGEIKVIENEEDFKAPQNFDNMISLLEAILDDIDLKTEYMNKYMYFEVL